MYNNLWKLNINDRKRYSYTLFRIYSTIKFIICNHAIHAKRTIHLPTLAHFAWFT